MNWSVNACGWCYALCPDCGGQRLKVTDDAAAYSVEYECPDCGLDDSDCYSDLCGVMAVPWGFLL